MNKTGFLYCFFLFFLAALFLPADEPAVGAQKENKWSPVFDSPEMLKPLDRLEPIWVTSDRKNLVLIGTISIREGLLEFLACRKGSKDYESIISLDIKPYLVHAGLLLMGVSKGHPARFTPEFSPAEGGKVEITVRWKDGEGTLHEMPAGDFVRNTETKETMVTPWIFTGSVSGKDEKGTPYYLANITGEIIGIANFAGSILDVPFESSADNDSLSFEPNTEKIPPVGTEVTLILRALETDR